MHRKRVDLQKLVSDARPERYGLISEMERLVLGGTKMTILPTLGRDACEEVLSGIYQHANYPYWIEKERLAGALFPLDPSLAHKIGYCNVDMRQTYRPDGRYPLKVSVRCEKSRCPVCSRRVQRQKTRELTPYFLDAVRRGHSIFTFGLTQPKRRAEDAPAAVQRLNQSIAKFRKWLLRQPEVQFVALGIDIVCSTDGYHAHAHVVYAGAPISRQKLGKQWRAVCEGAMGDLSPRKKVSPKLLRGCSPKLISETIFRAVFYAIKAEITVSDDCPSYENWARALIDLKGRVRLFRTWGLPKRTKARLPKLDVLQPLEDPHPMIAGRLLSDSFRQALESRSGGLTAVAATGDVRNAILKFRWDDQVLRNLPHKRTDSRPRIG